MSEIEDRGGIQRFNMLGNRDVALRNAVNAGKPYQKRDKRGRRPRIRRPAYEDEADESFFKGRENLVQLMIK
jgi:hypothetical protein